MFCIDHDHIHSRIQRAALNPHFSDMSRLYGRSHGDCQNLLRLRLHFTIFHLLQQLQSMHPAHPAEASVESEQVGLRTAIQKYQGVAPAMVRLVL